MFRGFLLGLVSIAFWIAAIVMFVLGAMAGGNGQPVGGYFMGAGLFAFIAAYSRYLSKHTVRIRD